MRWFATLVVPPDGSSEYQHELPESPELQNRRASDGCCYGLYINLLTIVILQKTATTDYSQPLDYTENQLPLVLHSRFLKALQNAGHQVFTATAHSFRPPKFYPYHALLRHYDKQFSTPSHN